MSTRDPPDAAVLRGAYVRIDMNKTKIGATRLKAAGVAMLGLDVLCWLIVTGLAFGLHSSSDFLSWFLPAMVLSLLAFLASRRPGWVGVVLILLSAIMAFLIALGPEPVHQLIFGLVVLSAVPFIAGGLVFLAAVLWAWPTTPTAAPPARQRIVSEHGSIGRNEPCWCGSGKKYKQCHG